MTKVKICGLSRMDDIDIVNCALPDYIGFVFALSRRKIDGEKASLLKKRLDHRIKAVGVFVNETVENIARLFERGIIDIAQLHGDEDANYIYRLKKTISASVPVIKAIGIEGTVPPYPENADYLLFDTLSEQRGGTGAVFDWSLLIGFEGPPFFVAGGISIENVSEVIKALNPYCIDASSGVETNAFKDEQKVIELIRRVRE